MNLIEKKLFQIRYRIIMSGIVEFGIFEAFTKNGAKKEFYKSYKNILSPKFLEILEITEINKKKE